MLLFVVANRLGLMSYLDGVELRARLQSMIVESNRSFDYAIPEYARRPLQSVYPPWGFQEMAGICISGPAHPPQSLMIKHPMCECAASRA